MLTTFLGGKIFPKIFPREKISQKNFVTTFRENFPEIFPEISRNFPEICQILPRFTKRKFLAFLACKVTAVNLDPKK